MDETANAGSQRANASALDEATLQMLRSKQTANPGGRPKVPIPLAASLQAALDRRLRGVKGLSLAQIETRQASRLAASCQAALAADLGARYSPARATLERFKIYDQAQTPVLMQLRALAANPRDLVERGAGLILFGTVGTGKDHLQAALLYAACGVGISCRWINGQEMFAAARDRMDRREADAQALRQLVAPTVLAISDPLPPACRASDWELRELYLLVERRYREMRSTWMTLNVQSVAEADAQLSEPVFDRLRENAVLVPCFWPSYRTRR